MTMYWGAWDTGSTNRGMRVGIDVTFSAVSNTSTTCTATMKFYTENVNTWDDADKQMLEFDGNYSLPETHEFWNQGDEAGPEYRTTRTYTWTYSASSYNVVPTVLDIRADLLNMYNGAKPYIDLHINFPKRPFGTPAAPTAIKSTRNSDTSITTSWTRNPTTGKPYDAMWVERYIYNYATWARVGTLAGTATSYADTGVVANRKYSYRAQADNSVGTSGYDQIDAPIYTTPAAPTSPVRTQGQAGAQALTWALAVGYTEYQTEVWRAVDGVWSLLTTLASGVTSYSDTTASTARKNKYKFRTKTTANATVLYSAYSADTTETTGIPTAPAAPTNLKPITGTIDPTGPVVHTWTHNPTDGSPQTFFEVQYRHVGDVVWKTSGKIASTAGSWTMPSNSVSKGNQVEWQVRTWGYSDTLAGAWSASGIWTTTPLVPLRYPLYLDVDSGRTEAESKIQMVTQQVRRIGQVTRVANQANSTVDYVILAFPLPVAMARAGKILRITAFANIVPDTAGMYTYLRLCIGVGAVTTGTQLAGIYLDHRIAARTVGGGFSIDYTFDPATAGGENISTINVVLVGTPGGGGSFCQAAANRPTVLTVDEIIDGPTTAGGGTAASIGTQIQAGNGLTGGGDLTANRVLDVVPGDDTLLVGPDYVKVNPDVIATHTWVDGKFVALSGGTMTGPLILSRHPVSSLEAATKGYVDSNGGGGGGGGGADDVVIDTIEPIPINGHPELWVDTDDDWGELTRYSSGIWGAPPLDIYGADTLAGQPIYVDEAGQMRTRPQNIPTTNVIDITANPRVYPIGLSIMCMSNADALAKGWPASGTVVSFRRSAGDEVITQTYYQNHTPQVSRPVVQYRSGNGLNAIPWSTWIDVGTYRSEIGNAVDLNTLTADGIYTQSSTAEAGTGTNYPVPVAGLLEVFTNNSNMVWQRYTTYFNTPHAVNQYGTVYMRGSYQGVWQPWKAMLPHDTGWIEVNAAAGGVGFADADWIDYPSATYNTVAYRKIGSRVFMHGLARTVIARTANSSMLVLPVGFRPTASEIESGEVNFNTVSGAASTGTAHTHTQVWGLPVRLDVTAAGSINVTCTSTYNLPVNSHLSLSQVSFFVD